VSLRGSVLLAGGCDLTLLNTTDIKKSRTVSVLCSALLFWSHRHPVCDRC
jgi:hypothetical protein